MLTGLSPALVAAGGAALGAIVGSFLGAILTRWPRGETVLSGRSRCDDCGKTLRAIELIPLLSWLLLRGRCARCHAAIDSRQFAMEAAAAMIGATAMLIAPDWQGLIAAILGWWLLVIAALDVEHHWLPDRLTLPLIPAGFMLAAVDVGPPAIDRAIGAVAGFAVLAAIALLYRRLRRRAGLGGGDPKLLAGIGAWLGWHALPLVLLGAGIVGLASLALRRLRGERIAATDRLPLGALMALAAWPLWLIGAGWH